MPFRLSNTLLGPGRRSRIGDEEEILEKIDVLRYSLDSKDRLRYPPVSLCFDMCLAFWSGRGVWENLFDTEFAWSKV